MKITKSPLQYLNFWILKFDLKTNRIEMPEVKSEIPLVVRQLFDSYEVDLDFMIKEAGQHRLAYVKIEINKSDEPKGGYSIFAEGVTRFHVKDENIRKYSDLNCIGIAIQNLRSYIAGATSDGQFGKYIFPSVELEAMFREKIIAKMKSAKQPAQPKSGSGVLKRKSKSK